MNNRHAAGDEVQLVPPTVGVLRSKGRGASGLDGGGSLARAATRWGIAAEPPNGAHAHWHGADVRPYVLGTAASVLPPTDTASAQASAPIGVDPFWWLLIGVGTVVAFVLVLRASSSKRD